MINNKIDLTEVKDLDDDTIEIIRDELKNETPENFKECEDALTKRLIRRQAELMIEKHQCIARMHELDIEIEAYKQAELLRKEELSKLAKDAES